MGPLSLGTVSDVPDGLASACVGTSGRFAGSGGALALLEFGHRAARGVAAITRAIEDTGHALDVREDCDLASCPALHAASTQMNAYFAGERAAFDLDLFLPGTEFQRRVWDALLRIPCGEVCSYGDIARGIGAPGASRAVGLSNGANRIAIVVPCHRVLDSAGRLHGYGGGLERKRWLLDHERSMAGDTLFAGAAPGDEGAKR
jgi:methylated-DNA-[protein]-cysteine S-methyltransferase